MTCTPPIFLGKSRSPLWRNYDSKNYTPLSDNFDNLSHIAIRIVISPYVNFEFWWKKHNIGITLTPTAHFSPSPQKHSSHFFNGSVEYQISLSKVNVYGILNRLKFQMNVMSNVNGIL